MDAVLTLMLYAVQTISVVSLDMFAVLTESTAALRATLAIPVLESAYCCRKLLLLVQPSLYPVPALMGVHVAIMGTSNLLLNYQEKSENLKMTFCELVQLNPY